MTSLFALMEPLMHALREMRLFKLILLFLVLSEIPVLIAALDACDSGHVDF